MGKAVIRWKLNELMAKDRIRNKDLAKGIGVTETSVYRLRKTDAMPRMSPERLNDICKFLKCQPGDLLVFVPDDDGGNSEVAASLVMPDKEQDFSADVSKPTFNKNTKRSFGIVLPFEKRPA